MWRAAALGVAACCVFVAALLLGAPLHAAGAAPQTGLSQKLQSTRDRLDSARAHIRQAEDRRQEALTDIGELDRRIEGLEVALDQVSDDRDQAAASLRGTQRRLRAVTTDLERTRARLLKAQQDLKRRQQVLNRRAANLYKSGRLGYVEVLIKTRRLDELVNRLELLSLLARQDGSLLGQIKASQARVGREKVDLERRQAQVAVTERQQRGETDRLEALVATRAGAVQRLDEAKSRKRSVVEQAEHDKASWERQEDALLAESASIAAKLRATPAVQADSGTARVSRGGFVRPVPGRITSPFGYRVHPIFHVRRLHTGLDMSAGMGTPIHASAAGTVVFAGWRGGYGRVVMIAHGGGVSTLYAHQSAILVSVGRVVERGQVIGRVGSTGYSTGAHLHFEVRVSGSPVDPMGYL